MTPEGMAAMCEKLSDVPSTDGFDITARSGIFVQPGLAILERVSHASYQRGLKPTTTDLLAARTGLDISRVSVCFLFPLV